ncbi:hypothetical protein GCM10010303_44540 [Streptomyces purpurascens]|nr:hypothetical protein GCM10010303_44540 [Streptomyces purpurascens]
MARRPLIRTLAGVSVLVTATLTAPMAPTASAAPGGRVCMVVANKAVGGLGHVGWLARAEDGRRFYYGAQDWNKPETHWAHGPALWENAIKDLQEHRAKIRGMPYDWYRCKNTPDGSGRNALAEFNKRKHEPYHKLWSNCLTRSVSAFKGYSLALNNLPSGKADPPNDYFSYTLDDYRWAKMRRL